MQIIVRYTLRFSGGKTGYCRTTEDTYGALSKILLGLKDERVTRRRGVVSGRKEYLMGELGSEVKSCI